MCDVIDEGRHMLPGILTIFLRKQNINYFNQNAFESVRMNLFKTKVVLFQRNVYGITEQRPQQSNDCF